MTEFIVDHFFWFWLGSVTALVLGLMGVGIWLSKRVDGGKGHGKSA